MASRQLVSVQNTDKTASSEQVVLPGVFVAPIRPDVVQFVHTNMNKNHRQAYGVSLKAGHQCSAASWGTGRAVSRIPRVHGGGTHRAGQGAFGNMCRGGRMFNPTKTWRKWHHKINITQRRYALASALAASAVPALVMARGHRVEQVNEVPLVVGNNVESISQTQKAIEALKNVGAFADVEKVQDSRNLRAGKGKGRNRRFTQRRGPLVIYKEDSGLVKALRNLPGVETCQVGRLNLLQVAPGGHLGRFIVWTKGAFEELDALYGSHSKKSQLKTNYQLPRTHMTQADLARIINSDEIQSVVRDKRYPTRAGRKKNALKNLGVMDKLNPYAKVQRRRAAQAKTVAKKTLSKDEKKKLRVQKNTLRKSFLN